MADHARGGAGRIFWIVAILFWAALFCATHIPAPRLPPIPVTDKTAHVVSYGTLALLLSLAVGARGTRSPAEVAMTVLPVMIAYGAIDEWSQIPVGRSCELADWYADVAGAATAVTIVMLMRKWRARRSALSRNTAAAIAIVALALGRGDVASARASDATTRPAIEWDRSTLRYICGGGYPRMIRLRDSSLLISCDSWGRSIVRRSEDGGATWGDEIVAAASEIGSAANGELLELRDGRVMLLYNERPRRDGEHPFAIRAAFSADSGRTWMRRNEPIYAGGKLHRDGCWEPAGVQLTSNDEIVVFFANETRFPDSDEQELSIVRSRDDGSTWDEARRFCFRAGGRDGMPVPIVLKDGSLVVAIEDSGDDRHGVLQPTIVAQDDRRWPAIEPPLDPRVYAGAPFLRQLPDGRTLLSCQSEEGHAGVQQMVVYIGDADAKHFTNPTWPFAASTRTSGKWNSLFVKDAKTVVALTTTMIDKRWGTWAMDGHIPPPP